MPKKDKKTEKPKDAKPDRAYKTVYDPKAGKSLVITVKDGSKLSVQNSGLSDLEMEMVLIKVLKAVQGK